VMLTRFSNPLIRSEIIRWISESAGSCCPD